MKILDKFLAVIEKVLSDSVDSQVERSIKSAVDTGEIVDTADIERVEQQIRNAIWHSTFM